MAHLVREKVSAAVIERRSPAYGQCCVGAGSHAHIRRRLRRCGRHRKTKCRRHHAVARLRTRSEGRRTHQQASKHPQRCWRMLRRPGRAGHLDGGSNRIPTKSVKKASCGDHSTQLYKVSSKSRGMIRDDPEVRLLLALVTNTNRLRSPTTTMTTGDDEMMRAVQRIHKINHHEKLFSSFRSTRFYSLFLSHRKNPKNHEKSHQNTENPETKPSMIGSPCGQSITPPVVAL